MHKLFLGIGLFLFVFIQTVVFSPSSFAASSNLVISEVQMGGPGSGTTGQEYIAIYNNSNVEVDVTGWCLQSAIYSKQDFTETSTLKLNLCVDAPNPNTRLILPSKGSFVVASNGFIATQAVGYRADLTFSTEAFSGSSTGGTLRIIDSNGVEIDKVGYGSSMNAEASPALFTPNNIDNRSIQRIGTTTKQDTDNNLLDFTQFPITSYKQGSLYEEAVIVDVCPNIPGLDTIAPIGYMQDTDGNCYEDVCDNIASLQKVVPNGYYRDGIDCKIVAIKITELLPNVSGSDTDKEFVEIYNPTNFAVDLGGYILQLGPSYSKNFVLPSFLLSPGSYAIFSDTQTTMTMPNTSASVKLLTPDSQEVDETASYSDPNDDQSWALFADSWQYTNQPTAQLENTTSIVAGMGFGETEGLAACPEGKYRNPETNRCRNIESDAGLKPCAIDQVRNPVTNRCRSIFTSDAGLTPCKAGQTRNPETNRCRSNSAAANTLKACAANQERNPETNRCRKKAASQIAAAEVKDVESKLQADRGGWLLAGTAGIGLASYGIAEWREEIALGLRRFRALLGKSPPTD